MNIIDYELPLETVNVAGDTNWRGSLWRDFHLLPPPPKTWNRERYAMVIVPAVRASRLKLEQIFFKK